MNFPQTVSLSPKQPKWQASASILHAKQNSKLANYAESANFAYLPKQTHNKCKNAKGLRPFKRSEPKNLRHKRTTSAKTPRGFDLSKGPNQKNLRQKTQNKCKPNAKGLRPFQGPNQKTFGKKCTISAKRTPRGFDLSKGPNQKNLRKKRHNKCKPNAKGLRPFKRSEPKNPSAKKAQ